MTTYTHTTMLASDDIRINGLTLNTITDDGCRWIVSDLDGWWGLPDVEMPEDPRPSYEDGSYLTQGRYTGRNLVLSGYIVPGVESSTIPFTVSARNTLNFALHLVRTAGLLEVDESDETKISFVQVVGRPLTRFSKMNDALEFNVQLRASDPVKYAASEESTSISLPESLPGRMYNRTYTWSYFTGAFPNVAEIINRGSYATPLTAKFYGPVLNPKLEHVDSGAFVGFDTNVVDGDVLTVDFRRRIATLASGSNLKNKLMTGSTWFNLDPGSNDILFTGVQTTGGTPSVVQLTYRSAWIE